MGGTRLTLDVARKALAKLEARDETSRGDAHPMFAVYYGERLVARTGLRRSSKPDIPVPHVKKDLGVNLQFILDLARCPKDKTDWLKKLGEIPEEPKPEEDQGGKDQS